MRYSGIQQIQLDAYGYSWIQWNTAGYSGSAAKWLGLEETTRDPETGIAEIQIQRDTTYYTKDQGYGEIQAQDTQVKCEIQAGDPKNARQRRANARVGCGILR